MTWTTPCRISAALGLALICASSASAQTASQITPPSFRPPLGGGSGSLSIPEGPGLEAPAGADRLVVRVGHVTVENTLPAMAAQTKAIVAGLEGQQVTAAAIFDAARALEQAYARAGYGLVRVALPAQNLADGGTLRLVVIDGRIGSVDTTRLPSAIRDRVDALLAPLVGQPGMTLARIERQLLLAGDTPGTVLRSTLAPGDQPGSSTLVIESRYKLLTGFVSLDNTLSDALGRYTTGVGLDVNSPTGHGELFYLRASGYLNDGGNGFVSSRPRNRSLATGVIVPIGTDGLTFNAEVTDARATPEPVAGAVNFTSDFRRYSFRLRYPVVRSQVATINTELAFDAQDEELQSISPVEAPLSLDRLRILRAAVDGTGFLGWKDLAGIELPDGVVTGRVLGSAGLDILGARGPSQATAALPLSRQGSEPDFKKLELTLTYSQPVAEHLVLELAGHAQAAFGQALPRSEQIGLATPSGLSSFAAGLFQGDSGYVFRGEWQAPFVLPGSLLDGIVGVAPYVFGATGQVHLNLPTAVERRTVRGASYGLGVRSGLAQNASFNSLTVSLEWGREMRSDRPHTGDRITFTTLARF